MTHDIEKLRAETERFRAQAETARAPIGNMVDDQIRARILRGHALQAFHRQTFAILEHAETLLSAIDSQAALIAQRDSMLWTALKLSGQPDFMEALNVIDGMQETIAKQAKQIESWKLLAKQNADNLAEALKQRDEQAKQLEEARMPEILFDGHAVYSALPHNAKLRTSPENVSDTLDAVVRLIRTASATPAGGEATTVHLTPPIFNNTDNEALHWAAVKKMVAGHPVISTAIPADNDAGKAECIVELTGPTTVRITPLMLNNTDKEMVVDHPVIRVRKIPAGGEAGGAVGCNLLFGALPMTPEDKRLRRMLQRILDGDTPRCSRSQFDRLCKGWGLRTLQLESRDGADMRSGYVLTALRNQKETAAEIRAALHGDSRDE